MPNTDIFGWPTPTVNGSTGTWGSELNDLFDDYIEETVNGIKTTADAAMPASGGAFTGEIEVTTERMTTLNKGSVSGTVNIDFEDATYQILTRTGNTTITTSNWPGDGRVGFMVLEVINGGSGTWNWPGAVVWDGGSAPSMRSSGVDVIVLFSRNGGTTIRGAHSYSSSS